MKLYRVVVVHVTHREKRVRVRRKKKKKNIDQADLKLWHRRYFSTSIRIIYFVIDRNVCLSDLALYSEPG